MILNLLIFLLASQNPNPLTYTAQIDSTQNLTMNIANGSRVEWSKGNTLKVSIDIQLTDGSSTDTYLKTKPNVLIKTADGFELNTRPIMEAFSVPAKLGFLTRMITKISSGEMVTINDRTYVRKDDGKIYEVLSHTMTVRVETPMIQDGRLKTKYSKLTMSGVQVRDVKLDLYETESRLSDIRGDVSIKNKYDDVEIKRLNGSLDADFYEINLDLANVTGDVIIDNKYRPMRIENIRGNLVMDGYESNMTITDVSGNTEIKNKYAEIRADGLQRGLNLDLYEVNVNTTDVSGNIFIQNKYGVFEARDVSGSIEGELYEVSSVLKKVNGNVKLKAKYKSLEADQIGGDVSLDTYEVQIRVANIRNFMLSGKYSPVELTGIYQGIEIRNYEAVIRIQSEYEHKQPIVIDTKYGSILLDGFDYRNYRIRARTKNAEIRSIELDKYLSDEGDVLVYQRTESSLPEIRINGVSTEVRLN